MKTRPRGSAGFSLAEVVVALGLLAGVLISVAGLLVVGHRLVSGGRGSSEALEVARDILEELNGWSFPRLYEQFDACDGGATACDVVIDSDDPSPDPATEDWSKRMAETHPRGCVATLRIESLDGATLSTTRALRTSVRVVWLDGMRRRDVRLCTARI